MGFIKWLCISRGGVQYGGKEIVSYVHLKKIIDPYTHITQVFLLAIGTSGG